MNIPTEALPTNAPRVAVARDGLLEYAVYSRDELARMTRRDIKRAWRRFHDARATAARAGA